MKVIGNNEKNTVDFADLKPGDCFRWDSDIYVKSAYGQDAICLDDGFMIQEMCGEQVTPVDAEVRIID